MAVTILTSPDYVLTGNSVRVSVTTGTTSKISHYLHLRIYKIDYLNGNLETLIAEEQLPVISGAATFEISRYLNTDLRNKFTISEDNILIIESGMVMWFKMDAYETYLNDGVEYGTTSKTATKYAFTGGLNPQDFNFYSAYFESIIGSKFLTWQPNNKKVGREGLERLYFFNKTETFIALQAKLYFDDDTDQTVTPYSRGCNTYRVYEFRVSFEDMGLSAYETGGKKITKFDVYLISQSYAVISDVKTYLVDEQYYGYTRYFLYSNSFGCFDCLRFTGLSEDKKELDHSVLDRATGRKDTSYNGIIIANTGFISKIWADCNAGLEYLLEIAINRQAYEITVKNLVIGEITFKYKWDPIIIVSKDFQGKQDNIFLRNLEIQYYKGEQSFFFSSILIDMEDLDINLLADNDGVILANLSNIFIKA